MNLAPEFRQNRAAATQIAAHLWACDAVFVPLLSKRVDIDGYARKIAYKAQRFEAWANDELLGLVAAYCNDSKKGTAFVTSVSVLPQCQGRGIASELIARCIDHVRGLDFQRIELEVSDQNHNAVSLYKRHRFLADRQNGNWTIMCLAMA